MTDTDMSNIPEIKKAEKDQNTSDNGEPNVNTDGRDLYHWESGYPPPARHEIRLEAIYISLIFLIALIGLFFTWSDLFWEIMGIEEVAYKSLTEIGIYFFLVYSGALFLESSILSGCCERILVSRQKILEAFFSVDFCMHSTNCGMYGFIRVS